MTDEKDIALVPAASDLREEFWDMAREWLTIDDPRYRGGLDNFESYMAQIEHFRRGADLRPGLVPSSEFWLVKNRRILGRISVRHRLNANLEIEGGHIGYDVRPSERRKGYGTLMLKLGLEKARKLGLKRVLITCDTDNIASAKIIEKNGGIFEQHDISPMSGKQLNQYWLDLIPG
jgi:predicted acetyltransferase